MFFPGLRMAPRAGITGACPPCSWAGGAFGVHRAETVLPGLLGGCPPGRPLEGPLSSSQQADTPALRRRGGGRWRSRSCLPGNSLRPRPSPIRPPPFVLTSHTATCSPLPSRCPGQTDPASCPPLATPVPAAPGRCLPPAPGRNPPLLAGAPRSWPVPTTPGRCPPPTPGRSPPLLAAAPRSWPVPTPHSWPVPAPHSWPVPPAPGLCPTPGCSPPLLAGAPCSWPQPPAPGRCPTLLAGALLLVGARPPVLASAPEPGWCPCSWPGPREEETAAPPTPGQSAASAASAARSWPLGASQLQARPSQELLAENDLLSDHWGGGQLGQEPPPLPSDLVLLRLEPRRGRRYSKVVLSEPFAVSGAQANEFTVGGLLLGSRAPAGRTATPPCSQHGRRAASGISNGAAVTLASSPHRPCSPAVGPQARPGLLPVQV